MIHRNIILLFVVFFLAACGTPTPPPTLSAVVPVGVTERRPLDTTDYVVRNCAEGGGVSRNPTLSIALGEAVEWEVNGQVGVGFSIGQGVIPGGAYLNGALGGSVVTSINQEKVKSDGWDLSAEQGYIVTYQIAWTEIWQPAYIDVTHSGSQITRVNVKYRSNIETEVVGERSEKCGGETETGSSSANPTAVLPAEATTVSESTPVQHPDWLTREQVNGLFGDGNWFCFPDRQNAVAVRTLPGGYSVQLPLERVDSPAGTFRVGDTVSEAVTGTAWFTKPLPQDNCPSGQISALQDWLFTRGTGTMQVNRTTLNEVLNSEAWACLPDFGYAVRIESLQNNLPIKYPMTAVDTHTTRFAVGETVPAGNRVTIWLYGTIPQGDCP